jgi:hypothetical protein
MNPARRSGRRLICITSASVKNGCLFKGVEQRAVGFAKAKGNEAVSLPAGSLPSAAGTFLTLPPVVPGIRYSAASLPRKLWPRVSTKVRSL